MSLNKFLYRAFETINFFSMRKHRSHGLVWNLKIPRNVEAYPRWFDKGYRKLQQINLTRTSFDCGFTALVLIFLLLCTWGFTSADLSVTIDGQQVEGPLKVIVGGWGYVSVLIIFLCVAIILSFLLAGIGIVVFGVLVLMGFLLLGIVFPFLFPLLISLFIAWAFCAGVRRGKKKMAKANASSNPNLPTQAKSKKPTHQIEPSEEKK